MSTYVINSSCLLVHLADLKPIYGFALLAGFLFVSYARVFYVVQKQKKSSFHLLFSFQLVVIMLAIFFELLNRTIQSGYFCRTIFSWFPEPTYVLSYLMLLPLHCFPMITAIVELLINMNRTFSVAMPLTYDKKWTRRFGALVVFCIVIPLPFELNVLVGPSYFNQSYPGDPQIYLTYIHRTPLKTSVTNCVYYMCLSIGIIISTAVTIYKIAELGQKQLRVYEKRTIAYGLASSTSVFVTSLSNILGFVFVYVIGRQSLTTYITIRSFLMLYTYLIPLTAILVFCSDIRKAALGIRLFSISIGPSHTT